MRCSCGAAHRYKASWLLTLVTLFGGAVVFWRLVGATHAAYERYATDWSHFGQWAAMLGTTVAPLLPVWLLVAVFWPIEWVDDATAAQVI